MKGGLRTGWVLGGLLRLKGGDSSLGCGAGEVLREGRAAWPAGPIESLPLCEPSLAGQGGAVTFFGFGAEPAFERAEDLLP